MSDERWSAMAAVVEVGVVAVHEQCSKLHQAVARIAIEMGKRNENKYE